MRNALTVDVEEYFQVEAFRGLVSAHEWAHFDSRVAASTRRLLDILAAHGTVGTFFIVGWVAQQHPALVREIRAGGHELACHSYAHRPIYAMARDTFRDDVRQAKRAIEDAAGVAVIGYRAPTCSVVRTTLWALDVLAEEGFRYDSSVFPIHHDRYGMPQAHRFPHRIALASGSSMVEFPMTTCRIAGQNLPFCGGGYFRLLPYALVRAGVRHVNEREGRPTIVYLHPWEVDPEQPRLRVHGLTRFRHYVNLHRTAHKLDRLLRDFSFAPASAVLQEHGLLEAPA